MKFAAATLVCLAVVSSACAADWSWQPTLDWRLDHNTNRLLSAASQQGGSQAALLAFDFALRRATSNMEWSLQPHVQIERFANDFHYNSIDDRSLQLAGRWQREYAQLTLLANAARESTLTTEPAATGILDLDTRRDLRNVNVLWDVNLTSESTLDVQWGYEDVDYPSGQGLGLVGYRYPNAALSYARQISQYATWSLTAFGARLDAPLTSTVSRGLGMRAGMTRSFSDRLSGQLSFGLSQTQLTHFFGEQVQRSQVWEAKLKRRTELGAWDFSLVRNLAPNGFGILAQRDEAGMSLSRALGSQLTGALSVQATRSVDRQTFRFLNDEYRYLSAQAMLDRNLAQDWLVGGRLGFTKAQRSLSYTDAQGWYLALAARWTPHARPLRSWLLQ